MNILRTKWWVGEPVPIVLSFLTLGAFVVLINVKPISAGILGWPHNESVVITYTFQEHKA